jgi:hypothetical protein
MRARNANYLAILGGSLALGSLGLLTQCGGGSDSPPAGPDSGPPVDDAGEPLDGGSKDSRPATQGDGAETTVPEASARIPCDVNSQACSGTSTPLCCSGFCTDPAKDPRNCGQCGVSCTNHQFCTGVQCDDAVVANVCANPAATVVFDQYIADNQAASAFGAALSASCVPPTTVVQQNQGAGAVDPASGRPITGVGNTLVTAGGAFGQPGIAYLDNNRLSFLYLAASGDEYDIIEQSSGRKVVSALMATLTTQHDFFYVQMAVEPQSGTLSFAGVGIFAPGTGAAGYYVPAEIIPNRANYPKAWYVFEWTDTNGDSIANAGDTFTQTAAAP